MDIPPDPTQRSDDVECAIVSGIVFRALGFCSQCRVCEPAERTKAIVNADKNDAMASGQIGAIVICRTAMTNAVASTMNPEHDRKRPGFSSRRCPDIEEQAVFATVYLAKILRFRPA
ncbi:MAG: hypothetical protein CMQ21_09000 [Gammaproteobacteria bacterium]|nr:hypothetical protein [Gammaproteobacteria bacterium]